MTGRRPVAITERLKDKIEWPASVRGLDAVAALSRLKATDHQPCVEWLAARDHGGYGVVWLDGRNVGAHVISLRLTVGDDPDGRSWCLHSCDNRGCVNPAHLRWGDAQDNTRDRMVRRRQHGRCLSESEVRRVIERLAAGEMQKHLAAEFGISQPSISNIATGTSWRWIQREKASR